MNNHRGQAGSRTTERYLEESNIYLRNNREILILL